MTREERNEAIEFFKEVKEKEVDGAKYSRLAIEALEQEPCEDCISRLAVIELIADFDLSMGQVVKGIHALPPVVPQPKIELDS